MRSYLQMGLLIGGCVALGAFVCGPGFVMLWVRVTGSALPDLLMLLFLFGGSPAGAYGGYRFGMNRFGQRGIEPWSILGWLGCSAGFALALWLLLAGKLHRFHLLWFQTLNYLLAIGFLMFCGAVGGLSASFLESHSLRKKPGSRRRH